MWLFSSLELGNERAITLTPEEEELCQEQIMALFRKLKEIEEAYVRSEIGIERGRENVGVVNCGTLHECVVGILEKRGLVVRKTVPVSYSYFRSLEAYTLTIKRRSNISPMSMNWHLFLNYRPI